MKVTLRTKQIQDGKLRLYLDFYPPITHPTTGKLTRREFLALFVHSDIELIEEEYTDEINGKILKRIVPMLDSKGQTKKARLTPLQKQHNKETFELADNIRAQRQLSIQSEDYGFLKEDKNADFLSFFKQKADEEKEKTGSTNYLAVYNYLKKFTNDSCPVSKLTEDFCTEFKEYLGTITAFEKSKKRKLSNNTVVVYYQIFITILRMAVKKFSLSKDPSDGLKGVKRVNSKAREYLTLDELKAVMSTPCNIEELKNAALFSAFTGLRYSDIEKLTWREIIEENGSYSIRFVTEKTETAETLPISPQAFQFLGSPGASVDLVFPNIKYGSWQNSVLTRWVHSAGITKHITFHCFRHSYATLLITKGIDVYTVSKMLGHKNIGTTQIYAKIIDEKKRAAADQMMIPV
jgi:integrase